MSGPVKNGFVHPGGPTEDAVFDYVAGRMHPQAAEWIAEHVAGCERCAEQVDRVTAVHVAMSPPEVPPFQQQRHLTAVRRRLAAPRRGRKWLVLSSGLAFAAVALAVGIGLREKTKPGTQSPVVVAAAPSGPTVPWTVTARQGAADVEVGDDHTVAQANMMLVEGSVLAVQPGARVVARWGAGRVVVDGGRQGARVRIESSRVAERRLRLENGRVILDVDPMVVAASVQVITDDAQVTVHGTVFTVDRSAGGTTVAVERGKVRVAFRDRAVDVAAGFRISSGAAAPTSVDADDKQSFGLVSGLGGADSAALTESLDVFADTPGAEVSVDGVPHGRAPLSLAVGPGVHRVRVTASGKLPVEERVDVATGTPTLFRAELDALKLEEPADKPEADARPAADVLGQARADVLAGNYGRAINRLEALRKQPLTATQGARAALLEAQAYRLDRRPERAVPLLERVARGGGSEAEQGQFMLGQTLQRDLLDPHRAAVVWADAQRRFPKGIFREEAAFRLGESLLATGETREGVEALERYLAMFPTAAHADDAHLQVAAARRDRLSDCTGAIPHLKVVAGGKGPRAEVAMIGQARCLLKVGRVDEASAAYGKYLATAPRGRFADEARANATARAKR